jgi:hypothetical protein
MSNTAIRIRTRDIWTVSAFNVEVWLRMSVHLCLQQMYTKTIVQSQIIPLEPWNRICSFWPVHSLRNIVTKQVQVHIWNSSYLSYGWEHFARRRSLRISGYGLGIFLDKLSKTTKFLSIVNTRTAYKRMSLPSHWTAPSSFRKRWEALALDHPDVWVCLQ